MNASMWCRKWPADLADLQREVYVVDGTYGVAVDVLLRACSARTKFETRFEINFGDIRTKHQISDLEVSNLVERNRPLATGYLRRFYIMRRENHSRHQMIT